MSSACTSPNESVRVVQTEVTVLRIGQTLSGYTVVEGYIDYCDVRLSVNNGNSGFSNKVYSLQTGQKVTKNVVIRVVANKNSTLIYTDPINFNEYIIK